MYGHQGVKEERDESGDWDWHVRTADTAYNIHNQRESTVEHRELYLMLCVGNPKMGIYVYM